MTRLSDLAIVCYTVMGKEKAQKDQELPIPFSNISTNDILLLRYEHQQANCFTEDTGVVVTIFHKDERNLD